MRNFRKTVFVCAASLLTIAILAFAPKANAQAPADSLNPYDLTGQWQNAMLDYYIGIEGTLPAADNETFAGIINYWYADSVSFSSWWKDFNSGYGYTDNGWGWFSENAFLFMQECGWPASSAYNMIETYDESGYLITTTQAAYLYHISNLVDSLSRGDVDTSTFVGNLAGIESDLLTNMTDDTRVLPLCVLSAVRAGYYYWNARFAYSAAPYVIGQYTAAALQGAFFGGVYDSYVPGGLGVGIFVYTHSGSIPVDIEIAISASIIAAQTSALYPTPTCPTPSAQFLEPTNTTTTATRPVFRIVTSLPIDTTSVSWNFQFDDSTKPPTVWVIPYDIYSTTSDSLWPVYGRIGIGMIIDDSTIEFQCDPLGNGQRYVAVVKGLRVVNCEGDTINVSSVSLPFTTVDLPPRLVSLSYLDSNGFVRCHDTITAKFSVPLESTSSSFGPLLSLVVPAASYDTVYDTVLVPNDSAIGMTAWLDPSNNSIMHILPTGGFEPGRRYQINVNLSGLTGDSTQDETMGFMTRKSFRLNITPVPTDGISSLPTIHFDPTINENSVLQYDSALVSGTMTYDTLDIYDSNSIGRIVDAGDTVQYTAPTQVGGALFKQWSGSGITAIDTSTNPVLTVTQSCEDIHDLKIVALYRPIAVDTVSIATTGENDPVINKDFVEVRSDSQDSHPTLLDTCASTSSVNYSLERGKVVTLHAYSLADTLMFDQWSSSDATINGQTNPLISFNTSGNKDATAAFKKTPLPVYQLCAYVSVDGVPGPAPSTIAQIISPVTPPCSTAVTCTSLSATLKIVDPNYGLESYSIDDNGTCASMHVLRDLQSSFPVGFPSPKDIYVYSGAPYPCAGDGTFTPPEATQIDQTQVSFIVKKLIRRLIIVIRTNDNASPDGTLLTFSDPSLTKAEGMRCWVKEQPLYYESFQPRKPAWCGYSQGSYAFYCLYYYSGTTVHIQSSVDNSSGDQFIQWETACTPVSSWCGCTNTDWPSTQSNPDLSFTMDQDRAVTATFFNAPFKLLSISYYQWVGPAPGIDPTERTINDPWGGDPNGEPVWQTFQVDIGSDKKWTDNAEHSNSKTVRAWSYGLWAGASNTWAPPYPYAGSLIASTPPHVVLHFNRLIAASIGQELKIVVAEETPAYDRDYQIPFCYFKVGSSFDLQNGYNAVLSSSGTDLDLALGGHPHDIATLGSDGEYYIIAVCEKIWAVWKGQKITLEVPSDVKSAEGESLSNPQTFTLHTENPDVSWYYTNSHITTSYSTFCYSGTWGWTAAMAAYYPSEMPLPYSYNSTLVGYYGSSCIYEGLYNDWPFDYGTDMHYYKPNSLPNVAVYPFTGGDPGGYGSGSSEQLMVSCSHCWNDRQFEAASEVMVTRAVPVPICSGFGDNSDGAREDWRTSNENVYSAMIGIGNGFLSGETSSSKGKMDQTLSHEYLDNEDQPGGNDNVDFFEGRAHFRLTNKQPDKDFWGAGTTYNNYGSSGIGSILFGGHPSGHSNSAESTGGSASFRAEIRVDIK